MTALGVRQASSRLTRRRTRGGWCCSHCRGCRWRRRRCRSHRGSVLGPRPLQTSKALQPSTGGHTNTAPACGGALLGAMLRQLPRRRRAPRLALGCRPPQGRLAARRLLAAARGRQSKTSASRCSFDCAARGRRRDPLGPGPTPGRARPWCFRWRRSMPSGASRPRAAAADLSSRVGRCSQFGRSSRRARRISSNH